MRPGFDGHGIPVAYRTQDKRLTAEWSIHYRKVVGKLPVESGQREQKTFTRHYPAGYLLTDKQILSLSLSPFWGESSPLFTVCPEARHHLSHHLTALYPSLPPPVQRINITKEKKSVRVLQYDHSSYLAWRIECALPRRVDWCTGAATREQRTASPLENSGKTCLLPTLFASSL